MSATVLASIDSVDPSSSRAPEAGANAAPSSAAVWTGRALSGFAVLFLAFDVSIKLLQLAPAVTGTTELGFARDLVLPLGVVELACLLLYVVPRTSLVGAVVFTGYLGGAIATHLRLGNPLFSHVLFPIYVAAFLWGGLFLRDPRVRSLIAPIRRSRRAECQPSARPNSAANASIFASASASVPDAPESACSNASPSVSAAAFSAGGSPSPENVAK